ncbi:yippee zinc-binding/DNA-binding /Mis18, centromere assembly-domain-containing protein [Phlyctochytrium arcticum]|nr:yippee zinc-binding/DNA-binding /Mis18, centromere assembly-domain-containing protein [Phlyctochytrium arcticum]
MGIPHLRYLTPPPPHAPHTKTLYGCLNCHTHLTSSSSLVSKQFQGQTGAAYLFDKVVNVVEGGCEERRMTTGWHVVRDLGCTKCGGILGWKYEKAYEESQQYKEGKYILEWALLCEVQ